MITNKLILLMNTEDKKRLLSNFLSLSILQAVNYLLPLITFPYLVRILGTEKFGLLAFATAVIQYFMLLVDYGFDLSATRQISVHRDNQEKVTEIFSTVITIKIVFVLVSLVLLTLLVFSFERFRQDWPLYYLSFCMVVGQSFLTIWFFQGMEQMKYITFLNLLAKTIFTGLIFIFVKQTNDFYLVPTLTSAGFLVAGGLSIWIIYKQFAIRYRFPSYDSISFQLQNGWHIFCSRIAVNLYSSTNLVILGFMVNNQAVGWYSIAEKITSAVTGIFQPVLQTLYPYLAKLHSQSIESYRQFSKKIALYLVVALVLVSFVANWNAELLIKLISGNHFEQESVSVFKILSVAVIGFPLGGLFTQFVIINQKNAILTKIVLQAALVNFFFAITLIYCYQERGLAITVLIVQVFVIWSCVNALKRI